MKTLKRVLTTSLILGLAAVAGLAVLLLTLDANRLKPVLQNAAAERGVLLELSGDISWQLYPQIGFSLGELRAYSQADNALLAASDFAAVSVDLIPLLQRNITVSGIYLRGLQLHYHVDSTGGTPWDTLTGAADSAPEPESDAGDGAPPELAIEKIDVSSFALFYQNEQSGDSAQVTDAQFRSQGVALNGIPFPVELSLTAKYNDLPSVNVALSGPVALNTEAQTLAIDGARVTSRIDNTTATTILSTETRWGDALASRGTVSTEPFSARPLLEPLGIDLPPMANDNALTRFGFSLQYTLQDDTLSLREVSIQLDQTEVTGTLEAGPLSAPRIVTRWQGTRINLDDYLPPPSDEVSEPEQPTATAEPLPLEALRELDVDARIAFDSVVIRQLEFSKLSLAVAAKKGLIQLQDFSSQLAEGQIVAQGHLNAQDSEAKLAVDIKSQGIDLGKIMQAAMDKDLLKGKISADVTVTSHGETDRALIDNLAVAAQAESEELRLVPFNLEQQFCRAIALLQQSAPKDYDWPDMTRLEPVKMHLDFAGQTLNLNQLSAEVAELVGTAKGLIDVSTGDFNIPFSLSLGEFAGGIEGCLPIEEKWRKRQLPIRCKGNLDEVGAKTCLPDTELLTAMLKDRVKAKAREKVEEKKDELEAKASDKVRELLDKELGEESSKNTEDKVRGLLDQIKKRNNE